MPTSRHSRICWMISGPPAEPEAGGLPHKSVQAPIRPDEHPPQKTGQFLTTAINRNTAPVPRGFSCRYITLALSAADRNRLSPAPAVEVEPTGWNHSPWQS